MDNKLGEDRRAGGGLLNRVWFARLGERADLNSRTERGEACPWTTRREWASSRVMESVEVTVVKSDGLFQMINGIKPICDGDGPQLGRVECVTNTMMTESHESKSVHWKAPVDVSRPVGSIQDQIDRILL